MPAAMEYAFGFGRQVCPGCWMAHAFVSVVVASVLSAFHIRKVVHTATSSSLLETGKLSVMLTCVEVQ